MLKNEKKEIMKNIGISVALGLVLMGAMTMSGCKLSTGKGLVCLIVDLCDLYGFSIRSVGRMCLKVDRIVYLEGDVGSC